MLGVNSRPFSPFRRSSLLESRHGLQWAGTQVDWIANTGDAAALLDQHDVLFEEALPSPRDYHVSGSRAVRQLLAASHEALEGIERF